MTLRRAARLLLPLTIATVALLLPGAAWAVPPTVTSVNVPASATYGASANLDFVVHFDQAVLVDTTGGTPRIALTIGSQTRYATYLAGSGTTDLTFRHTVLAGATDADGIVVGALSLNGGTLQNAGTESATLTLNSVGSTAAVLVDAVVPVVVSVAGPADSTYLTGQNLSFLVTVSRAVVVDTTGGIPSIPLDVGGTTLHAYYLAGAGTTTLSFAATIPAGLEDLDGIATPGAIATNGGTLNGPAANALDTTLNSVASTAGVLVDSRPPTVVSTAPTAPIAPGTTTASFDVTFSEPVASLAAVDLRLTATGTATGTLGPPAHVSPALWRVTVTGISGTGTLRIDVPTGGMFTDAAGNALQVPYASGATLGVAPATTTPQPPGPTNPVPPTCTVICPTDDRDDIAGTDGDDTIRAGGGDDSVAGGDGDDVLLGQDGDDAMRGQAGNDSLMGGAGNDRLFGGLGDDRIGGGAGNDSLWGGPGADRIFGNAGDDDLHGGPDADALFGGPGADRLLGNAGDDVLSALAGRDAVVAGAGDDLVIANGGSRTRVSCGGGNDLVFADAGDVVLADCERVVRAAS